MFVPRDNCASAARKLGEPETVPTDPTYATYGIFDGDARYGKGPETWQPSAYWTEDRIGTGRRFVAFVRTGRVGQGQVAFVLRAAK